MMGLSIGKPLLFKMTCHVAKDSLFSYIRGGVPREEISRHHPRTKVNSLHNLIQYIYSFGKAQLQIPIYIGIFKDRYRRNRAGKNLKGNNCIC